MNFPQSQRTQEVSRDRSSRDFKCELSLLQLAVELGIVAKTAGTRASIATASTRSARPSNRVVRCPLIEQRRRARNPHPNRVSEEVEKVVLDCCLQYLPMA